MNKVIEIRECSAAYGENAVLHKVSLTIEIGRASCRERVCQYV